MYVLWNRLKIVRVFRQLYLPVKGGTSYIVAFFHFFPVDTDFEASSMLVMAIVVFNGVTKVCELTICKPIKLTVL